MSAGLVPPVELARCNDHSGSSASLGTVTSSASEFSGRLAVCVFVSRSARSSTWLLCARCIMCCVFEWS